MNINILYFLLVISFSEIIAQEVKLPLTITDNAGGILTLFFGLDHTATDGIDPLLGESALPPVPPTGSFDARFILPGSSDDSQEDYRFGNNISFSGNITYKIQFQAGSGKSITISWDLPSSVSGNLKDQFGGIIVNVPMTKNGNTTITNLAINKLDMTIQYHFVPTGINDFEKKGNEIPDNYELNQNYPNPFNPTTKIEYWVPISGKVTLKIYDVLGREIETLVDKMQESGKYEINWNALRYSSGVYFYSIRAGSIKCVKKMLLLK